jgi:hypothetical protein
MELSANLWSSFALSANLLFHSLLSAMSLKRQIPEAKVTDKPGLPIEHVKCRCYRLPP